jgi:arabinogalactan oligomer / maltooligosaccharide transport system substrate-binding protein
MKKLSSIIFAVVMILLSVGCGSSQQNEVLNNHSDSASQGAVATNNDGTLQPEEGAKLVIWEDGEDRVQYMKYVAEKFKEKYGVEVEIKEVFGGDLFSRLIQDAPSNMGPDLFEASHDSLGNIIAAGLLQPNDNTAEKIKTDCMDSVAECLTYDGEIYGYPTAISTYALFYNKELVSTPPETFQDIIDFAKTYNNPKEHKYALMWQVNNVYLSHSFLAGHGAYVFGNSGTDKDNIGLNTNEAIEGAKFFHSLKEILNLKSADTNSQVVDGLFGSGKLPYTINGLWAVTTYTNAGVDFGVVPLPKMPNGSNPVSFSGVQALFLSAYSNYPNAAKLFAEMATSEEMLLKRYEMTHEIPPIQTIIDNETIKSDPITSAFLQQAQNSTAMPSIPQMALVWDPYMRALQSIWDNDSDPKAALDECVSIIKSSIEAQN